MNKRLEGPCQHCGGTILFVPDAVGTTVTCPHCAKPTELMLARPPEEPAIPKRVVIWTIIAVIVLVVGLAASFYALKRAQKLGERQKRQPASQVAPSPAPQP